MSVHPDSVPAPPVKRHSTKYRMWKWVLITVGVLALSLAGLILFAIIQVSGGWPWAFTADAKETDAKVVAVNAESGVTFAQKATALRNAGAAVGLNMVASTSQTTSCDTGQHNWKINDNYDLECLIVGDVVLGSDYASNDQLKRQLLAFHDKLEAGGWKSVVTTQSGWPSSIRDAVSSLPGNSPGSAPPFLRDPSNISYFQGEQYSTKPGTTRLAVEFGNLGSAAVNGMKSNYSSKPSGELDLDHAFQATQEYLRAHDNRYVVVLRVTTSGFIG